GIGKRGLERLQAALVAQGLSLSGNIPEPSPSKNQWTIGHTGVQGKDIKTHAGSDDDLQAYLSTLEGRRVDHAALLLEIFAREIGRASCRERVYMSVVLRLLKKYRTLSCKKKDAHGSGRQVRQKL